MPPPKEEGEPSLTLINYKIDELKTQVTTIVSAVEKIIEHQGRTEIWKTQVESRLAQGAETMATMQKEIEVAKTKCDAESEAMKLKLEGEVTALEISFNAEISKIRGDMVSREMIKWIVIGATASGGGVAYVLKHMFGV